LCSSLLIKCLEKFLDRPIIILQGNKKPIIPSNLERFRGKPIFIYYNGQSHYDSFKLKRGFNRNHVLFELINDDESDFSEDETKEYLFTNFEVKNQSKLFDILNKDWLEKQKERKLERKKKKIEWLVEFWNLLTGQNYEINGLKLWNSLRQIYNYNTFQMFPIDQTKKYRMEDFLECCTEIWDSNLFKHGN